MTTKTNSLNNVDLSAVGKLAAAIQADPDKANTYWKASVTWTGGFRSEAQVRKFAPVPSDEPAGLGGGDTAANPVEQLLAALGNCLAVGYAANASAAGIEIKGLRIDVEGDLDLHTFMGLNAEGDAGFQQIRASVHIDSEADAGQLAELHNKVTGTSPVGDTLARPIPIQIELA